MTTNMRRRPDPPSPPLAPRPQSAPGACPPTPASQSVGQLTHNELAAKIRSLNEDLESLRYFHETVRPRLTPHQLEFLMALNPRIGIAKRTKLDGAMRNKNELEHLRDELATANEILMAILPLPTDPCQGISRHANLFDV